MADTTLNSTNGGFFGGLASLINTATPAALQYETLKLNSTQQGAQIQQAQQQLQQAQQQLQQQQVKQAQTTAAAATPTSTAKLIQYGLLALLGVLVVVALIRRRR